MKKKILALLGLPMIAMILGGCGQNSSSSSASDSGSSSPTITTRYTVAFEVDGERYQTLKVKEGEKITETVANPSKEGFKFIAWCEDGVEVVLADYVVTHDVTFTAKFEEIQDEDVLSVDDVKEDGKEYYMVLGWWESTDTENASFPYSGLTKDSVRLFYGNVINYLKATGSSDEQIANIQFRNYSSNGVAAMGTAVNTDNDVDMLIGVGANVFTTAGCLPFHESADSKFGATMGTAGKERQVALLQNAREISQTLFTWLQTDIGKKSFVAELTDEEIAQSLLPEEISLTVTVHGDTDAVTTLTDKTTAITMPTITTPDGYNYKGFATSADGEVVLNKAVDATLYYDDVKSLVAEGADTLDLYPVFEAIPAVEEDLVVYVQTGSNLSTVEAQLLESRYCSTVSGKNIRFVNVDGDAATFTTAVEADNTIDVVVGGNNPLKNYTLASGTSIANAGAKHFASTNRKVAILGTSTHSEDATDFYNFVVADAPEFVVHSTFWRVGKWVTEDEKTAIETSAEAAVTTTLGIGDGETLADKYNVTMAWEEIDPTITGVADLGDATRALRDGKGTDIIFGCGANVTTTGGFEGAVVRNIPTETVAADRKLAIINENVLTDAIADAIAPVAEEETPAE